LLEVIRRAASIYTWVQSSNLLLNNLTNQFFGFGSNVVGGATTRFHIICRDLHIRRFCIHLLNLHDAEITLEIQDEFGSVTPAKVLTIPASSGTGQITEDTVVALAGLTLYNVAISNSAGAGNCRLRGFAQEVLP